VPGAILYYEMRGTGPLLLILQGGDGDAGGCKDLVDHLADSYTVVTYDRRGLSRSKLDDPAQSPTLETHADDAHYLLATLTNEPVRVFGGSLGALLGLDLVTRYPGQVQTLVAHEPPLPELLPEEERASARQSQMEIEEAFQREGLGGAMKKMAMAAAMDFQDREPGLVLPTAAPQRVNNLKFFLTYDAPAVRLYRPNVAALKAASTRIVLAAGAGARANWLYRATSSLADRLETDLIEFPGGHNGYVLRPTDFAERLKSVLTSGGHSGKGDKSGSFQS
jgi:pimeloyl-ACP methyl ester carboxylesterase